MAQSRIRTETAFPNSGFGGQSGRSRPAWRKPRRTRDRGRSKSEGIPSEELPSSPHSPRLGLPALGLARATGLEPATSGVTGRRSNQLNYARLKPQTARGEIKDTLWCVKLTAPAKACVSAGISRGFRAWAGRLP